jgi:hypothetical protein
MKEAYRKAKTKVKSSLSYDEKDKYKTIQKLVLDYEFPFERHFYETEDGYINTLHRISGPRGTIARENAQDKDRVK